jgi:glycosyltransferase involved in cell wall biosynthesis
MLRRHKGIAELVELLDRLDDPRYKLLFVGSRETPDQRELAELHPELRILPPQDREAMARINLAADLVVLWLNPEIPASAYQMPYKATDAFAMNTPVIANDISDLGSLGRQGYLRLAPFGDWEAMQRSITELFAEPERTEAMCSAARRLYLRQFSYAAARASFGLALERIDTAADADHVLGAARSFASRFESFYLRRGPAPGEESATAAARSVA